MALGQQDDAKGVRLLQLSAGISSVLFGVRTLSFAIYFGPGFVNFDPAFIGLLFTVSQLVGAMFAIPIGVLADKWGRKKFIVIARFLQAVAFLPLIFSIDVSFLLVALILLEIGTGTSSPPFNALLADKTPIQARNAAFSRNFIAMSIGSSIGSAVSILPPYLRNNYSFGNTESYTPLFIIMLLLGIASLSVVTMVRESKRSPKIEPNDQQRTRKPARLTSTGKILKYSLTLGLIQLGAGMIVQLFSLWLRLAFGVTEIELAPLYVVINLTMGLGYFFANKLAASVGTVPSIVMTQFVAILLLVMLPNIPDFQIVGIVYILRTAIMNMSNPILTSFICSVVPVDERASALSISNSTGAVTRAMGPAIGGYLMTVSLATPFYICGSLYAVSTAIFYLFFRRTRPQEC